MPDNNTNQTVDATFDYITQGWSIIPVHGLADPDTGHCSCGQHPCGVDNRSAGKHPVQRGWSSGPPLSSPDAYALWGEENLRYNIGVRTGEASGFYALDVEHEGLPELAELTAIHGPLPRTRTHRTGGGGKHFLFCMPDFAVRNNDRKLAAHIDIRGTGGMIVLPPSVSGRGAYSVEDLADIADGPAWLTTWLRSRLEARTLDHGEISVIEDLPPYEDLAADDQQRCQRYAHTVIEQESAKYASAPPGSGNSQLFQSACNILEIVQSPWNLYTYNHAFYALNAARERRLVLRPGGGQTEQELHRTFLSARSKTIGKGRPLPADPRDALLFDAPFTPTSNGVAGNVTDDLFLSPENNINSNVNVNGIAHHISDSPGAELDPVELILSQMLDRDGIDALPTPQPLIMDVLDKNTETWLISPPGGFKSFVALDWAIHVGMGLPWRGQRVEQGNVIYLAAEGVHGLGMRVRAWEETYGQRSRGVHYLTRPIQAGNPLAWAAFVEASRQREPTLIIIDTQARVTVGMEENSAKEMGIFIDAVRRLREATKACIVVVHHTNADGTKARGSTSLMGAMDTEILIERPSERDERLLLTAQIRPGKQKDMPEDLDFSIQMTVVDLGVDPDTGRSLSSLALIPWDPFMSPPKRPEPDHIAKLPEHQQNLMMILNDHANNEFGATMPEINRFLIERGWPIKRSSAHTAMNALIRQNLIFRNGARYILSEYADQL